MIAGINEQDFIAYIIFGLILNFLFSILFGMYLSKNIGMQEMISSKGDKQQSTLVGLSLFIPFHPVICKNWLINSNIYRAT